MSCLFTALSEEDERLEDNVVEDEAGGLVLPRSAQQPTSDDDGGSERRVWGRKTYHRTFGSRVIGKGTYMLIHPSYLLSPTLYTLRHLLSPHFPIILVSNFVDIM